MFNLNISIGEYTNGSPLFQPFLQKFTDFINGQEQSIQHRYTPLAHNSDPFPDESVASFPPSQRSGAVDIQQQVREQVSRNGFYPSIKQAVLDRHFLFVFPYYDETSDSWDKNYSRPVDVFNIETQKSIGTFDFPQIYSYIRNGYIFEEGIDENGFREIRIYKINPVVYGLPEDPLWREKH